MQEKLEKLLAVSKQIKELQEVEKLIKDELLADEKFDKTKVNGYIVNKVIKRTVKLKKEIEVEDLYEKFPDVKKVTVSTDMKILQAIPEAHDYLEIVKSQYIMIKEEAIKDDSF